MPRGRNALVRCRRCERELPHEVTEYGGLHDPVLHVNNQAFDVRRTGMTKIAERYGDRKNVTLHEYVCARGHTFWSFNGTGRLRDA